MDKDEVIKLAEQCGAAFSPAQLNLDWDVEGLEKFVALVVEKERARAAAADAAGEITPVRLSNGTLLG